MERLTSDLDASDLELIADPKLMRGFSFNARERNCLFVNGQGQRFIEGGYPLGVDVDLEGRGVAVADLDQDGGLDLVVRSVARQKLLYLRNTAGPQAHFLRLELQGTASARDAIGAVVRLSAGGLRQTRLKSAGTGFQGQSEGTLHFGLGSAREVDWLVVRWPSGREQRFERLPVDRVLRLREGDPAPQVRELPTRAAAASAPAR